MVTAFVLINIEDRTLKELSKTLLTFPGVKELHVVAGEYDIIAVLRVANNSILSELITEKIIHCPGVRRTKTLVALESKSPYDLAKIFEI